MKTYRLVFAASALTSLVAGNAFAQQNPSAAPVIAPAAPPAAPAPAAPPPASPPTAAQPAGAFEGGAFAAPPGAPAYVEQQGPATMEAPPPQHEYQPHDTLPRKGSSLFHVNWDMSFPVGSFNEFIGETSFRGIEAEGRFFLNDKFSLGIGGAWQLYSQTRGKSTYEYDAGAITTTLYRSTEVFALRFSGHYYPVQKGLVRPFVGVAMGPSSTLFQTLAADFVVSQSSWWFTIQPEAGVLIGVEKDRRSYGLSATFRYSWMPAKFNTVSDLQTIGGQFGLYILM